MTLNSTAATAYILVAHGSRDPRYHWQLHQLVQQVKDRLGRRVSPSQRTGAIVLEATPPIFAACLELTEIPLHHQIAQLLPQLQSTGIHRLAVLPLFLLPGVHVVEDVPAEVAEARQNLPEDFHLELRPHLGVQPGIATRLAQNFNATDAQHRILLAHGSRRADANRPIEALAASIDAIAAYWSVSPTLDDRLPALSGRIAVLPYFLFSGKITAAIADTIARRQTTHPQLQLAPSLSLDQLSDLIVEDIIQ